MNTFTFLPPLYCIKHAPINNQYQISLLQLHATKMPSLILVTFLLQLTLHLINTIGTTPINEFLWTAYTTLRPSTSESSSKLVTLKGEVVRLKRELAATSAQDDFAKWAKLRRQHDKAVAEYDKVGTYTSFQISCYPSFHVKLD
jgi:hypothetical protein